LRTLHGHSHILDGKADPDSLGGTVGVRGIDFEYAPWPFGGMMLGTSAVTVPNEAQSERRVKSRQGVRVTRAQHEQI
jgi:hypothetical protein